jgi:hypothetical protein
MWKVGTIDFFENMFDGAVKFNQDITTWCVKHIASEPTDFAKNCPLVLANKPSWGAMCLGDGTGAWYSYVSSCQW